MERVYRPLLFIILNMDFLFKENIKEEYRLETTRLLMHQSSYQMLLSLMVENMYAKQLHSLLEIPSHQQLWLYWVCLF